MGPSAFYVLAFALCGVIGAAGVLLGLRLGVRTVQRDEGRYELVAKALETFRTELSTFRIEWGTTLEQLEQLAQAVEKGRRRIAASESRAKAAEAQEAPVEMTPAQARDEARRRIRRIV